MQKPDKAKTAQIVGALAVLAISLFILGGIVYWFFFRHEIPKGKFGVLIYKGGLWGGGPQLNSDKEYDPTKHNIINKDSSTLVKGIQAKILSEGWHFYNPLYYSLEIHSAQTIEKNKVGVLFVKDGALIDNLEERILAKPGERGVQEQVIHPGTQRYNPYLEEIEVRDLQSVPSDRLGVVVSYEGVKPKPKRKDKEPVWQLLASEGQKGLQKGKFEEGSLLASPLRGGGQYEKYSNTYAYHIEHIKKVSIGGTQFGVLIAQEGNVPEDPTKILVNNVGKEENLRVKGIESKLLEKGEFAVNPYQYRVEVYDRIDIPSNKVGIKIAQDGIQPKGTTLSRSGEKGIQKEFLKSGSTELVNPYEYQVQIMDWVQIPDGHVGAVTSYVGKKPEVINGKIQLSDAGERGVQKVTLDSGNHYINPYEKHIEVINIRSQSFELQGQDELIFPSKDGFLMGVDVSVEWQIDAEKVPEVLMTIGDEDDILRKVIRPNLLSAGRIHGSKFTAEQFILGDSRAEFKNEMEKDLSFTCGQHGIIINRANVRKIRSPKEIQDIIMEKEIAIQDDLRNKQQIETAKSKADLAREEAMKLQRQEKVKAETLLITAKTQAEQEKSVANTKANQELEVAKIGTQRAIITANQKKEVASIAAEKEKSVADINQKRAIIDAQKLEEVAEIGLEETSFKAQSVIAKANAEARSQRVLFNADGGLEVKLAAWRQVMTKMAANQLIPRQIIQGSDKIITSEYVKAFVQLMDESLSKHLEYKPLEEELKLRKVSEATLEVDKKKEK